MHFRSTDPVRMYPRPQRNHSIYIRIPAGQAAALKTALAYAAGIVLYVWVLGALVESALSKNLLTWVLVPTLGAVYWQLQRVRRKSLENGPMTFEELPEPAVQTLSIT